jgi:hypothetical protein
MMVAAPTQLSATNSIDLLATYYHYLSTANHDHHQYPAPFAPVRPFKLLGLLLCRVPKISLGCGGSAVRAPV